MIRSYYGNLEDMPKEFRDTVAHIYFHFCVLKSYEHGGVTLRGGPDGQKENIADFIHYVNSVKYLPELIRMYRDHIVPKGRDKADYTMKVYILMHKYRVSNISNKRLIFFPFYKVFNRRYARRVSDGFYDSLMRD